LESKKSTTSGIRGKNNTPLTHPIFGQKIHEVPHPMIDKKSGQFEKNFQNFRENPKFSQNSPISDTRINLGVNTWYFGY
jgi:hypothetical protein